MEGATEDAITARQTVDATAAKEVRGDREEGELTEEPTPATHPSQQLSFKDLTPRLKPEHFGVEETTRFRD